MAEYEQISNPANSQPIVLERVDAHEMAGLSSEETHTKQLYRLTESSMKAIEGGAGRVVIPFEFIPFA